MIITNLFKNRKFIFFIVFLTIAIQLGLIIYTFAYRREGFHSDESWTYGFANSYYDPYIYWNVGDDPYLSTVSYKNMNEWLDGSVYKDYLVVNEGEQFTYDSVISNVRGDIHPPLHDLLVHTICSFFPDTFSWWYSFSINIAAFILCQIFLFDLGRRISGSDIFGLIAIAFYGLTTGALNCFIYLRAYALMTAIVVIFLDVLYRIFQKDFRNITKELIACFSLVLIGSELHYYFYLIAFFMTAFICIYLLCRKRWKIFLAFGMIMLLSAALSFAVNPSAINNIFGSVTSPSVPRIAGDSETPYITALTYCLTLFFSEIIGMPFMVTSGIHVLIISVLLLLIALYTGLRKFFMKINWFSFIILASSFSSLMLIAYVSDVSGMNKMTDRYLFYLEPGVLLVILLGAWQFSRSILKNNRRERILFLTIYLSFFLGCNHLLGTCFYLFPTGTDQPPLHELAKDNNIVVVLDSQWQMEWYCAELYQANQIFNMQSSDIENEKNTQALNDFDSDEKETYIVIAQSGLQSDGSTSDGLPAEKEVIEYFEDSVLWIDSLDYQYELDGFCGYLKVYKVN